MTHKKDTLLVNEFQKVLLDDKDLFKNMFTMNKLADFVGENKGRFDSPFRFQDNTICILFM